MSATVPVGGHLARRCPRGRMVLRGVQSQAQEQTQNRACCRIGRGKPPFERDSSFGACTLDDDLAATNATPYLVATLSPHRISFAICFFFVFLHSGLVASHLRQNRRMT